LKERPDEPTTLRNPFACAIASAGADAEPDGVDGRLIGGLNAGGLDLNRDWGQFTQPETKALSTFILEQAKGAASSR